MLRLSSRAIPGSSGPPVEGSPPPVVVIELGVTSRAVIWPSPPSPVPTSAVRPPCGLPLALALIAASALLCKFGVVGQAIGTGDAARPVVVIDRFDPQMDSARIAGKRMWLYDPRVKELEPRRQRIDRRPTQQSAGRIEAHDVEHAGEDDAGGFERPREPREQTGGEQQHSEKRIRDREPENFGRSNSS